MDFRFLSRAEFMDLALQNERELFELIGRPDVIIVKQMYDPKAIRELRDRAFQWGTTSESSWHPCLDGCPDYHRLHDNYPGAHVKQKMHGFYWHGYYQENAGLIAMFQDIFAIKNALAGMPADAFIRNKPSDGQIARVNIHHYPVGGGYQAEHVDPVSQFARLQTLVMASQIGEDYQTGGLYARSEAGGEKVYVDEHTNLGDLMVLSPGIQHGVAEVNPSQPYDWQRNNGRWIIMPIIINSDYERPDNVKPRQVEAAQ